MADNELSSLVVHRRVFVDRDENRQVATVMHYSELSNLLRVGNMTFLNVGQLLPHQLEAFHTPHYIYPIGYKVVSTSTSRSAAMFMNSNLKSRSSSSPIESLLLVRATTQS